MSASFVLKRPKYLVGNKPFSRLSLKERAVFILYMGGLTQREIAKLGIKTTTSTKTINNIIAKGYEEYNC